MRLVAALLAAIVLGTYSAGAAAAPPSSDNTAGTVIRGSTPAGSFKHKDMGVDLKDCRKCHKKDAAGKLKK